MNCHWCDIQRNAHSEFNPQQAYCLHCREHDEHPQYCLAELRHGQILNVFMGTEDMGEAVTRSVALMEQGLFSEMLVWNSDHACYRFTRSADFSLPR